MQSTTRTPEQIVTKMLDRGNSGKSRMYSGVVGPEYYCTSCAERIQLTNTKLIPKYCPVCMTPLITDAAQFRVSYSKSLGIPTQVFDILMIDFRNQSAFTIFREYVECVMFGHKPTPDKKYIDTQTKGKM